MPTHEIDVGLESDEVYIKELLREWDFHPSIVGDSHYEYVVTTNVFGGTYFSPITSYHAKLRLNTWEQLRVFIGNTFGEAQIYRRKANERVVYLGNTLVMAFKCCLCHETIGELIEKETKRCLENQNL